MHVDYQPRQWAIPFHASFQQWAALVLHRRAGKSTAVLHQHQRAATDALWEYSRLQYLAQQGGFTLTNRQTREIMRRRQYAHILPYRSQAKLAAWEDLKLIAKPMQGKPNESELRIDYPNGNWIRLFGADNPDAFRSAYFNGVSFDEFSQHPPNIFSESLSKAMADHFAYGAVLRTSRSGRMTGLASFASRTFKRLSRSLSAFTREGRSPPAVIAGPHIQQARLVLQHLIDLPIRILNKPPPAYIKPGDVRGTENIRQEDMDPHTRGIWAAHTRPGGLLVGLIQSVASPSGVETRWNTALVGRAA